MPKPVKPNPRPPSSSADHPTPAQLRAARALLGWSQADLAAAAGVAPRTLKGIELAADDLAPAPGRPTTLLRLVQALGNAGISFQQSEDVVGVSRRVVGQPPAPVPEAGGEEEG